MLHDGVQRHRTALTRTTISRPLRVALEDGLISTQTSVFDYGCGRGGDLARLRSRGISASGWDPAHRPNAARSPADIVNLGYVVNVIENLRERAEALKTAWSLAGRLLVVSAQLEHDMKGSDLRPLGDGFVTKSNTFQKYFTQTELRDWVDATLGTSSVPAAPGILYAFKDPSEAEEFVANRYRRARQASLESQASNLLESHRELLQPLIDFVFQRGRLPVEVEVPRADEVTNTFGSYRRAAGLVRRLVPKAEWEGIANDRREDLLLYVALSRFSRRPRFGALSETMQRDVKGLFGSYRNACSEADAALLALGELNFESGIRRSETPGKFMPTAIYVHRSAIPDLPLPLRLYEGCASSYLGDMADANVVKLGTAEPRVSYLTYPDFERDPHPRLLESVSVSLQTFRIKERNYGDSANPPILHRKDEFVSREHPLYPKFRRLTEQEERFGLFAETSSIGTARGWEGRLTELGVSLRGHRVVKRRDPVQQSSEEIK